MKGRMNDNPQAERVHRAMLELFASVGYTVENAADATVLHYPHLVSHPDFDRDEQREQIQLLTEIAVKDSGVPGVTFVLRDTDGLECRNPRWHWFHVSIRIPDATPAAV